MATAARTSAVVAAVLLPPLGIWLSEGATTLFWIGLALTLVGFVPGLVFALLVVLKPELFRPRREVAGRRG